ncbi:MerC domain-containing protein [Nonlabens mediterrranea]|uniref:MerC domain-containing protein n=1 Tax=Nonlabens mediterrranea TaxID=1419947 RepID=A0ABS0A322_9FLAO|nr:hypothetical protein BBFL7_02323 [Flavobacteria bacterium BBFL7]MBF4983576.1 MerC domain-containing protein [Nonlabens mediterrranea]
MIQTKTKNWADTLGIIGATLCIIHCLSMPLLLTMGLAFLENPIIAGLFIGIAIISISKATGMRFNQTHFKILWVSLIGFIACLILEEKGVIFKYGMYAFSLGIIIGHIYNVFKRSNANP